MLKQAIATKEAPNAIGPYSQAVACDGWLYLSGQIPLDPGSGELVVGDVALETRQVMNNLAAVLKAAGVGFENVVTTTIYLSELADFPLVNQIYETYLSPPYPARATVQVAALPKGARLEIAAVARLPNQTG
ncbi:MAG: RidA family protein [Magnetococcales bacterium]|nr:RidA family protein [Magnetococcales bacterium]